jgi:hypothetical protein
VEYWDPSLHVFRFGLDELCPTVEEFAAYLRGYQSEVPVIPGFNRNMSRMLSTTLNISHGAARFLLEGGSLNILRIIAEFSPTGDEDNMEWQARRRFALTICILAAYFLVSSFGPVDPLLVGIADQLAERKNIVPLVLGETLVGLDRVRAGQTTTFGGSPLLLQVAHSTLLFPIFTLSSFTSLSARLAFGSLLVFSSQLYLVSDLFSLSDSYGSAIS